MRPIALVAVAWVSACAHPPDPGAGAPARRAEPEPREDVSAAPAPESDVVERWACARVAHPLADFHRASLELRADATFELHHVHTTPERGWSTLVEGRWERRGELVLTPVAARRRRWVGDGHRHQHGEPVPYEEWDEPVPVAPWRLLAQADGSLRLAELGTRVYRTPAGSEPSPCDEGAPPTGRRP